MAPLNHVINALTISMWVYPTTALASGTTFFERLNSSAGNPGYVKFNYQSSRLRLTATDNTSQKIATSIWMGSFALNTWTHIALTYDGASNLLFYKNGVQLGGAVTVAGLTSIPATSNTANTYFRALSFGAGNYVDDYGYFGSRALTPTEINSIYTNGLAAFVIPEPGSLLLLSLAAPLWLVRRRRSRFTSRTRKCAVVPSVERVDIPT